MTPAPPSAGFIRELLLAAGLSDAHGSAVALLGDGFEQWAFRAGDLVVRLPKDPEDADIQAKLRREAALSPLLASLPLPTPRLTLHQHAGGRSFSTHPYLEGVPPWQLRVPLAADFGASLGRFLRALHALEGDSLHAVGMRLSTGSDLRERHIRFYEDTARDAFPMLSCEARAYVKSVLEASINAPAMYAFSPALIHNDIDTRNVLANHATGRLMAVIDFGDAEISAPAIDFADAANLLMALSAEDQLSDLQRESGLSEEAFEQWQVFRRLWWPLWDIMIGRRLGLDEMVEEGITGLNKAVPFGTRC